MRVNKISLGFVIVFIGLQITFLILKLKGTINWSWVWVLAPIWIPYATVLLIGVFLIIYLTTGKIINRGKDDG